MSKQNPKYLQCPKCKGKGEVRDAADWWFAIPTLGISLLDKSRCPRCRGEGWIRNPNHQPKEENHDG